MLKVGLTGGMGSGKSTVSSIINESGIKVIDADIISREVLKLYPEVAELIKSSFGEQFFDNNGELKRKELGNYIFHYPQERKNLESIIIPFIKREIFKLISEYDMNGERICIIDAPTLIEHDLHKEMDINILVWVDKATQISRLKSRDRISDKQVIDRLNSQMSLDRKKEYVDFVIDNSSSILNTTEQVENVINVLKMYIN